MPPPPKPNYGIDAPSVVRNLFIAAALGLIAGILSYTNLIPMQGLLRALTPMIIACVAMGSYMYFGAKYGKIREREWLLNLLPGGWKGTETVLDVGCGRGVMLIGAAKRLTAGTTGTSGTAGTATGIDIWQTQDLSGNKPEATLENARLEGVADRVTVKTADMRELPFPDHHFDVIVSNAAIHNLYKPEERAAAIREIARTLKPGSACILSDIRHEAQYTTILRENGITEIHRRDTSIASPLFAIVSLGRARPFVIIGRKPPAPS